VFVGGDVLLQLDLRALQLTLVLHTAIGKRESAQTGNTVD
jgi:hypothetical protein